VGWRPPDGRAGGRGDPRRPGRIRGRAVSLVNDGIESAVAKAKEIAGDKIVGVASPDITRQCLDAGLLDGIRVSLVPVLLGSGVPWFADLANAPVQLEGPTVTEGDGVTHLSYRVKRA
jgi:dihydrofolate reductase